jgi:DNA-binding response OmpR family regulator
MKKILVLDDDKDNVEILDFILKEFGYEVHTLSRGDTIFEVIKTYQPDLLLMDVMLAGMDGRVICRSIKENALTSALPVILLSGTHDLAKAMQSPGAPDDYIVKPYDIDNLLEVVKKQLG